MQLRATSLSSIRNRENHFWFSEWNYEAGRQILKGRAKAPSFSRASNATYWDADGNLQVAGNNVLRIDHDPATGECLGLLSEGQKTNKISSASNANPTDLTGLNLAGTAGGLATLTLVDDRAALEAAGLSNICGVGNVFKLDNTAGSSLAYAGVNGGSGNTNPHSSSAYVRGGSGRISSSNSAPAGNAFPASAAYRRVSAPITPALTSIRMFVCADPGQVVYFILTQWEEGGVSSPIITEGSSAIRAEDVLNINDMSWFNQEHGVFICKVRAYPGRVAGVTGDILRAQSGSNHLALFFGSANQTPGGRVNGTQINATNTNPTSASTWEYMALCYDANGSSFFARRVGNAPATVSPNGGAWAGETPTIMAIGSNLNGHLNFLRYEPRLVTSGAELRAILDALPAV